MAKGDIVLIRSKQGQPGVRRIWDDTKDRPYVCHEEYWGRWERNRLEPVCWQVGRDQIFVPDEGLARLLEDAFGALKKGENDAAPRLAELWRKAQPWGG